MSEPIRHSPDQLEEHLRWKIANIQFVISELDKVVPSPQVRGKKIYDILKSQVEVDTWDVICACTEMLAFLLPTAPSLESPVRQLSKEVFSTHYLYLFDDVLPINELQNKFAKLGEVQDIPNSTQG